MWLRVRSAATRLGRIFYEEEHGYPAYPEGSASNDFSCSRAPAC